SINRLAKLAAIFLLSLLNKQETHQKLSHKKYFFYHYLHEKMVAYFWAKSINPYLKCNLYNDIKVKLKKGPFISEQSTLYLSKLYFDDREMMMKTIPKLNFSIIYDAATSCGEMLGENLYLYIHKCDEKKALKLLNSIIHKVPTTMKAWKKLEKLLFDHSAFKQQEKTFF
nr:hypothetical protein [Bacteriovoracaceae bacterium]